MSYAASCGSFSCLPGAIPRCPRPIARAFRVVPGCPRPIEAGANIASMSEEVTVTFQGELGVELHVDRASGAVRIKRAEADSPAKPHEGATLRSINGRPVGKIESKAAWLALVERLQAPARPLVLALAVPEALP